MNLTKNFTLEEMVRSQTAKEKKIDNTPNKEQIDNLKYLCVEILQPMRELLRRPVIVNSGYRCPALNKAIKGAVNSQHLKGEAADITLGSRALNITLFKALKENGKYDQLIDEKDYQ